MSDAQVIYSDLLNFPCSLTRMLMGFNAALYFQHDGLNELSRVVVGLFFLFPLKRCSKRPDVHPTAVKEY